MADCYLAAEERAREARRAGLQAKKDEQPANTARSYAAKQREWRVSLNKRTPSSVLVYNYIEMVSCTPCSRGRLFVYLAGRGACNP
jgi:hypothetical protein